MKHVNRSLLVRAVLVIATAAAIVPATPADDARERAASRLDTLMTEHRNASALTVDWQTEIEPVLRADASLLDAYLEDPSARVRERAVAMLGTAGDRTSAAQTRRDVVDRLVKAAGDSEAFVYQRAGRLLVKFDSADYSNASRDNLRALYRSHPSRSAHVLAAGAANLTDLAEEIGETAKAFDPDQARWRRSVAWISLLARARMGYAEDIEIVVAQAKNEDDYHQRYTRLSYDLAYVRQPQTLAVLREMLSTSLRAPEIHAGTRMPYSEFPLDALTRVFEDFPVAEKSPGRYTPSELRAARRYMRDWGTIKR